jgi:hypothetical protein
MGIYERLDCAGALVQGVAQGAAAAIAGLDDVTEGNGVAREFRTDGPTQEALVVKDTDFGHVARIITNDHGFAHVGRQGGIKVAKPLETNAIRMDFATFGHRSQEQVELFKALRQTRQKAALLPARLGRLARFTVRPLMILVETKALQLGLHGRQR